MLVIDGNSILNRAFYGMPALTSQDGLQTGAIYGMTTIILPKLDELAPEYAAVAFDLKAPTFRHKIFDGYKATRKGMPEELAQQLPYAKKVMEYMGFRLCELEGYEADDLLGTLAHIGSENGVHVYILTGDRDSLQLIGPRVSVLLAGNHGTDLWDEAAFAEKYGTVPARLVDIKALMGDSSDNIPGIPGIGEKTAVKLISECGSLDGIYEKAESGAPLPVGKSALEKIINGKESAYLSYKLALIDTNVPAGISLDDTSYSGIKSEKLLKLFNKLNFDKLIKRLELNTVSNTISQNGTGDEYTHADSINPADITSGNMLALSVVSSENGSGKVFIRNDKLRIEYDYRTPSELSPVFSGNTTVCVYDLKELIKTFASYGTVLPDNIFDVSLAAYVINPGDGGTELSQIASAYAGITLPASSTDDDYYRAETDALYELYSILSERIKQDDEEQVYYRIELPLARVLAEMELTGFKVDCDGLRDFGEKLGKAADESAACIYELAGTDFNINSPKQLGEILFDKLMLPAVKKTKSGYSTSAEVLEKLRPYHPIIDRIFEYRQVTKLRSTYADGLLRAADSNGIIHSSFKQNVTATGRLSSAEPNLQNIPIRTELGRQFRKYFIPRSSDRLLIDADYSQIELRILAHMSGDPAMLQAFVNGDDIHTVTASQVFGVPQDNVTPELRKRAKAVNFGIVYGIGDFSLAADIGVTKKEAKAYINSYFAKYSGIHEFMEGAKEQARTAGFVTTLYGRKRYIPEIHSPKAPLRAFGERAAMNSPVQGTAADIIKIAMIKTAQALKSAGIDARLILQVHDELIVEAHRDCAAKAAEILREQMEHAVELSVPLTVDLTVGETWYDEK